MDTLPAGSGLVDPVVAGHAERPSFGMIGPLAVLELIPLGALAQWTNTLFADAILTA